MTVLGPLVQRVENVLRQIHIKKNSAVKGVGKKQTMLGSSDSVDSIIHAWKQNTNARRGKYL